MLQLQAELQTLCIQFLFHMNKEDPKQHAVCLELKSEQATIIVLQYSHVLKDTSEKRATVMNNFWVLKIFVG